MRLIEATQIAEIIIGNQDIKQLTNDEKKVYEAFITIINFVKQYLEMKKRMG